MFTTKRLTWISIIGASILFSLVLCLCVFRCKKGRQEKENTKRHDIGTYKASREKPKCTESVPQQNYPMEKGMSFIVHSYFLNLVRISLSLTFCSK